MSTREWQRALKRVRRATTQVAPDAAWVEKTRASLQQKVVANLIEGQATTGEAARAFVRQFLPQRFVSVLRGPVLAVLSIFGFLAGGSIASVSAAEQSVPGDFFYPLKIVKEQASLILTKGKTDKLKLKTEFVGRRVEEMKTIAASDFPKKQDRLKESVEVIKRDVNTVKEQLADTDGSPKEVAQAARLVDQRTTEAATALNDVKSSLPAEAQDKVNEAQAAATSVSVKAVQVLLENHDKPEVSDVVSNEELVLSVQSKVEGIEQNLTDASQKLITQGLATTSITSSTNTLLLVTTSTSATTTDTASLIDRSVASSSVQQINTAKQALDETRQLIQDQNLNGVKDKLGEVVKATEKIESSLAIVQQQGMMNASSTVAATSTQPSLGLSSSTTSSTPSAVTSTTSTPVTTNTSTSATPTSTSSTGPSR